MNETGSNSLVVVIGAGASYDCIANQSDEVPLNNRITVVDSDYRPPLTMDLFAPRPAFNEILDNYPLVSGLSEDIRVRLRKGQESESGKSERLEQILRELAASQRFQTRKHVWEAPLYLQE